MTSGKNDGFGPIRSRLAPNLENDCKWSSNQQLKKVDVAGTGGIEHGKLSDQLV